MKFYNKILIACLLFSSQSFPSAVSAIDILQVVSLAKGSMPGISSSTLTYSALAVNPATGEPVTLSELEEALVANGAASMSEIEGSFTELAVGHKYPSSININWATPTQAKIGFSFVSNPWDASAPTSANVAQFLHGVNWAQGVTFVQLAFDASGKYINNVAEVAPSQFYLYIFNATTGAQIAFVQVLLEDGYSSGAGFASSMPWPNSINAGVDGNAIRSTTTFGETIIPVVPYPAKLTLTGPATQALSLASLQGFNTLASFKSAVVLDGMILSPTSGIFDTFSPNGNVPISFNVNIGNQVGFSFLSNPWNSSSSISGRIKSLIENVDWSKGASFILLGFDVNGNVISNLTATPPTTFYMFMFDSNGKSIGSTPCSNGYNAAPNFAPAATWPNTVDFGVNSTPVGSSVPYPAIFKLVGPAKDLTFSTLKSLSYTGLERALAALNIVLNQAADASFTAFSHNGNFPSSFNVNIGTAVGLAFFKNPWNSTLSPFNFPGIESVDWSQGVSFVTLALDTSDRFIPDLAKQAPATFVVLGYDEHGDLIGCSRIAVSEAYTGASNFAITTPWPTTINFGLDATSVSNVVNYPASITITGPAPLAMVVADLPEMSLRYIRRAINPTFADGQFSTFSSKGAYPAFFNINLNNKQGFAFGDVNPWNSSGPVITTPFTSLFAAAGASESSWECYFLLLAFDQSGNYVPNLDRFNQQTGQLQLVVFNAFGDNIGVIPVPVTNQTSAGAIFSNGGVNFGFANSINYYQNNYRYPACIKLVGPKP